MASRARCHPREPHPTTLHSRSRPASRPTAGRQAVGVRSATTPRSESTCHRQSFSPMRRRAAVQLTLRRRTLSSGPKRRPSDATPFRVARSLLAARDHRPCRFARRSVASLAQARELSEAVLAAGCIARVVSGKAGLDPARLVLAHFAGARIGGDRSPHVLRDGGPEGSGTVTIVEEARPLGVAEIFTVASRVLLRPDSEIPPSLEQAPAYPMAQDFVIQASAFGRSSLEPASVE